MYSLELEPICVLSILMGPHLQSMPCQSLNFPKRSSSKSISSMNYMLLRITKTTQGLVALSIFPFLVIDDNIQIRSSTNDYNNEVHCHFEKYVISKSCPYICALFKICFGLQMHNLLGSGVTLPCHTHLGGALKMIGIKTCAHHQAK